mmetsp:Transcript_60636/g.179793  ORF Transcript_60636/g.179793 Transcript_60636/m.179793 type:complete len:204 (-) Transcript_60636:11-622(-)
MSSRAPSRSRGSSVIEEEAMLLIAAVLGVSAVCLVPLSLEMDDVDAMLNSSVDDAADDDAAATGAEVERKHSKRDGERCFFRVSPATTGPTLFIFIRALSLSPTSTLRRRGLWEIFRKRRDNPPPDKEEDGPSSFSMIFVWSLVMASSAASLSSSSLVSLMVMTATPLPGREGDDGGDVRSGGAVVAEAPLLQSPPEAFPPVP